MAKNPVVIVGAGLAGLSCALRLQQRGIPSMLLEKSDCVGGRVRTHVVDGYRMDRGFQVLLTAYPKTQLTVDYAALELKPFNSGALVRHGGRFHRLADPSRHPGDVIPTLLSGIGKMSDRTRMLNVRDKVIAGKLVDLLSRPEVTTEHRLREYGFSQRMVDQFFRPFLGGIFLESDLITSSRKFEFVLRMFSQGEAALPKMGMQAIPQQIANKLRPEVLRNGAEVKSIAADHVTLASGERVDASAIVLAVPEPEAARLTGRPNSVRHAAVTVFYYSAASSPVRGPWLVLNGDGTGPINNLCVPTELHPNHAPPGKSLISVTVLGVAQDESLLERKVRQQLVDWYGASARDWEHIRTYAMPEALPLQAPPALQTIGKTVKLSENLFACGDYLSITSIEGAISSGIRCAEEIAF